LAEESIKAKRGRRGFLRDFLRRRQHPVRIIGYTSKTLWLLLIPLAKNIVASNFNIGGWLRTYWLDLFVVLGILGFAVFRWLFVYYRADSQRVVSHFGPFGLLTTCIYFSEVTAVRIEQGYLYRAVGACTIHIETEALSYTRSEMKLVISEKSAVGIFGLISKKSEGAPCFSVAPKKTQMLIFSLIFSSTLSGIVIFAALMFQIYRVLGREFERQLAYKVNGKLTELDENLLGLSKTVPQAVLAVGGIIVFGWLISFASNLTDNWNFRATRRGGQILVESGAGKRTKKVLYRSKISYFDIRQTLLMKLAGISSVHILCSGYSKKKKNTAALIPIARKSEMNASLRLLAPELGQRRSHITAGKGAWRRFIMLPLMLCPLPALAAVLLMPVTDRWHTEISIFALALTVPLVWMVLVRAVASKTTSVGITDKTCTLSYCRGFHFHKVVLPRENLAAAQLSQTVFQRIGGTCTLTVWTDSEKRLPHRIKKLRRSEVSDLLARSFPPLAEPLLGSGEQTRT